MRRKARAWESISSGDRPQSVTPEAEEETVMEDDMVEVNPATSAPSSAAPEPEPGTRGSAGCGAALRGTEGPPSCCAISLRMSAGERSDGAAAPCS